MLWRRPFASTFDLSKSLLLCTFSCVLEAWLPLLTELPGRIVLGNRASGIGPSRKLGGTKEPEHVDPGPGFSGNTGGALPPPPGVYLPSVGSWTGRSTSVPIKSFI